MLEHDTNMFIIVTFIFLRVKSGLVIGIQNAIKIPSIEINHIKRSAAFYTSEHMQ